MLAALDNNYNAQRKQETTASGNKRHKIAYRKVSTKFVAKKVLVKKDYGYMKKMLKRAIKLAQLKKKRLRPTKRALIIERRLKYSRYNKSAEAVATGELKLRINFKTLENN